MIRRIALLLFLASPANALSCLPPDAVRLYSQATESDERFVIVKGRLDPAKPITIPEIPKNGTLSESEAAITRVRMTGHLLGEEDFSQAFDGDVDVSVTCLSVWCGDPVTDRDILGALRLTDDVPVLEIGPCGGNSIPLEQADLKALLACHRSGKCQRD